MSALLLATAITLTTPSTTPPPTPIWSVPLAHAAGVLVGMRLSLSLAWPGAYALSPLRDRGTQFARAYTSGPEFHSDAPLLESDGDPWTVNIIGHGLFGSEVYSRARNCGAAAWQAALLIAGASTLWEYGIESFNKRPSGIDLVATPILGVALGEARIAAHNWLHTRPRGLWRSVAEIVVDPFGEAERGWLHTRC